MITVDELLAEGRELWPDPMTPEDIALHMGVIYGDVCRAVRDLDRDGLTREMGNMIRSSIRWADDLGIGLSDVLDASLEAQRRYVEARR